MWTNVSRYLFRIVGRWISSRALPLRDRGVDHVRAAVDRDVVAARGQAARDLLDGRLEAAVGGRDAARSEDGDVHPSRPAYRPARAAARTPPRRSARARSRPGARARRAARARRGAGSSPSASPSGLDQQRGRAAELVRARVAHREHRRRPTPSPRPASARSPRRATGGRAPPRRRAARAAAPRPAAARRRSAAAVRALGRRAGEHQRQRVASVGGVAPVRLEQRRHALARLVVAHVEEVPRLGAARRARAAAPGPARAARRRPPPGPRRGCRRRQRPPCATRRSPRPHAARPRGAGAAPARARSGRSPPADARTRGRGP